MFKFINNSSIVFNYRRMWPYIKPFWVRACIGVALTVPVGALDGVVAMFLKPFMDRVMVEKQHDFSLWIPFLIVGFTVVQGCLIYASNYVNTWVASKITINVKRKLYEKLLSMDTAYFDTNNSGTILMRYSNDAETASAGLVNNLKQFLSKLFSSISLVFVLFYNSWQLALIGIAVLGLFVYPMSVVRKKMKDILTKTVGNMSYVMTIYNETFAGNKTIRSFTLENEFIGRFHKFTDMSFNLAMKMVKGTNWLSPLMHVIMSIGIALVIGYGSYLIVNGIITSGNFVSFIAALMLLYTPLKSVGNNYVSMQQSFLAIERIFEILELKPSIQDKEKAVELEGVKTGIAFEHVSFNYTPDREVLHDISLQIPIGHKIALVGNSGGGKTTVSSLLPRLYEVTKGKIKIDGIDIKDMSQKSLRRNIAMVFQDNFLFSGSIKDNILLGNSAASDEVIWHALEGACLADFVKGLPQGLDTQIGERGILLSGGQKQRLAIARTFVKDAPIVILDEATSALDNKSEQVVQQALDNLMKNRTVIVIAHRLSTVKNADKIIVINNGSIVEEGKHEELLEKKGVYATLYSTQFEKK